jgi:RimJ/RimL family protein N-acetyltransferase
MENYQSYINDILDRYKCKSIEDYLIFLPVYDESNNIVAYLRPITSNYLKTIPYCVELMSRWRVENPTIGTGVFTVTHERTKRWLDNFVVNNSNRIVFLVVDFTGTYLGHIGYAAFQRDIQTAEIDSVLRGKKNVIPGLMQFCMNTMIKWGRQVLLLKEITLKVFSDNIHAVEFYERCGFIKDILIPLVKVILPDEEKWEISPDADLKSAERYYLKMIYTK